MKTNVFDLLAVLNFLKKTQLKMGLGHAATTYMWTHWKLKGSGMHNFASLYHVWWKDELSLEEPDVMSGPDVA